jgi:hypothetical protein
MIYDQYPGHRVLVSFSEREGMSARHATFFIFTLPMLDNLPHFITILLKNSNKNNSFMEMKNANI